MKNLKLFTIIGLTSFLLASFTVLVQSKIWEVPSKYKSMKNPTDAKDKDNMVEGKALFAKQCSSCHGKKGLGDGSKAEELKGDLGDFSTAATQKNGQPVFDDGNVAWHAKGNEERTNF